MPVSTRSQSKNSQLSLIVTEKTQKVKSISKGNIEEIENYLNEQSRKESLWIWFNNTIQTYIKIINDCAKLRGELSKAIILNVTDYALNQQYINNNFNQLRTIVEMMNIINTYYIEINEFKYCFETFGLTVYKKLIDLYNEIRSCRHKLCNLNQSQKEEDLKIMNIIFEEFKNTENIISNLISIDANTYEELQQSKNDFIRLIDECKHKLDVYDKKRYNLRNKKVVDYTGMDTIEPLSEFDGITDILYDYTISYDNDYNPDNLVDRVQVLLDQIDDDNFYEYVVDEY